MARLGDAPTHAVIRSQLERILASSGFARSRRIQELLRFVVEETLAGRGKCLKGYTLALRVFGRDETFDPQTDSIVRVEAGRLRRRLEHYYSSDGRRDPIRIGLPKGGYVPTFELAAKGEGRRHPDAAGAAIAVLPFDNMSGDPSHESFSDGITEEIIAHLARQRDLDVIARHTTFQYKGRAVDVRALGSEVGASYVLEGSVRQAAGTVRVTAQLLDTDRGVHLWVESYDRALSAQDTLKIQDDISTLIAGAIASPTGVIHRREAGRLPPPDPLLSTPQ